MHGLYIQKQKHAECRKDVGCREVLCSSRPLWVQLGVCWGAQRRLVGAVRSVQGVQAGSTGAQRSAGSVGAA